VLSGKLQLTIMLLY